MDTAAALQLLLDENRRLTERVAALTAASPPQPPPLAPPPSLAPPPPLAPPPAELGYDAYLAGSAPWEVMTVTPSVLARFGPMQQVESYLAPKRLRRAYGDSSAPSPRPPEALSQPGSPVSLNQRMPLCAMARLPIHFASDLFLGDRRAPVYGPRVQH